MGWSIFIVLCVVLVFITTRNVQEGFKGQRGGGSGGVRYGGVSNGHGGHRGGVRYGGHGGGVRYGGHGGGARYGGHGSRGWTTVGSGGSGGGWGWWWPFEWPWYQETVILIQ